MKRTPRKSATQWAALVSEYDAGSENEQDFCHRHNLKLVTLRKWRYHFKSPKKQRTTQSQAPFVKVNVSPSRAAQEAAVLYIGQDIRLECPASYDVSSLAQLALAVHHGR